MQSVINRAQLVYVALLLLAGTASARTTEGTVSGLVRDSAGVPQIGAEVQLLRPNLSVVRSVFTDGQGRFSFPAILPGRYALKAMGAAFLPALRENVRVRGGQTMVNLTLNTLYEVIQWLPAEPRSKTGRSDDWDWTLRSAANRPLLRWLEDGPLVVVSDGSGAHPRLKARIMATGQAGTFGESGERITAAIQNTPNSSKELLAQVDFAPNTDAAIESMLGFRQDLGLAGSVQSVAAFAIQPEVEGLGNAGFQEASLGTHETMNLGPSVTAEAGSAEVLVHSDQGLLNQSLPFAEVGWRTGSQTWSYRYATAFAGSNPDVQMPRVALRDGQAAIEHGVHQEIDWQRSTATSTMRVVLYSDRVANPVLEASARPGDGQMPAGLLFDPRSGLARIDGSDYRAAGIEWTVERQLPSSTSVRADYASGSALVMPAPTAPQHSQEGIDAPARRVETFAISLSGTLDGTGTRWRASYRWQPDDTLSAVTPFDPDALDPYLNLRFLQQLHRQRDGGSSLVALIDIENLLAQGYHPYLLSDGTMLIFASNQRAFRAGVAFTF